MGVGKVRVFFELGLGKWVWGGRRGDGGGQADSASIRAGSDQDTRT